MAGLPLLRAVSEIARCHHFCGAVVLAVVVGGGGGGLPRLLYDNL